MKNKQLLSLLLIALLCCVSCGAKKNVPVAQNKTVNPFGETYEAPCTVYDTPTEFAATGIFKGSMHQKGDVHQAALKNAQDIVRQKVKHVYKGMISGYSSTIGNNNGNDIANRMQAAGYQVIDAIINNTAESCVRYSGIGEDGMIECYVAIQISKEETSKQVAKKVNDVLTEDEKLRIKFDEAEYRKQMDARFKEYNENR